MPLKAARIINFLSCCSFIIIIFDRRNLRNNAMIENVIPVLSAVYNNDITVELFMTTLLLKHTHFIVSDKILIVHTANVIMILSDTSKIRFVLDKE